MNKPKIIAVLGPTASGKSDLAVELARKFNGEIISADSRQVYKGLDIGSGKITKKEMRGIPHHLLDVASPLRTFTVAQFQKLGGRAIKNILRKNKVPIIAGGTGLYIDTLLYGYNFPAVKPNPQLRGKLERQTTEELFDKLSELDPARATGIDRFNKRRLVRALEIVIATGKPVPKLEKHSAYDTLKIGINISQEKLRRNIELRLKKRLRRGMLKEINHLRKSDVSFKRLQSFGLEYRAMSRYTQGLIIKKEMEQNIISESIDYTKRQTTWWKRDKEIRWINNPAKAILLTKKFLKQAS
ncbi:MAG: tRNA (adenosine(37)-N6)-dimethylallyltransferase MiaA [Candidatus Liptonbacteria bacterium]